MLWERGDSSKSGKEKQVLLLDQQKGICYKQVTLMKNTTAKKNKKKPKKPLIVQIDVIELEAGEYFVETTQLSDLIIPLTKLELTTPPLKNPVPKKDLKQTIADAKTYIQKLGRLLRREVIIKVKKS